MKQKTILAALCSIALTAFGGIVEWPMYLGNEISETNGERLVIFHILTGTFPDGSPAVKRVDETSVRYFQSISARSDETAYFVYELNCASGENRVFSFGSLSQQRVHPTSRISNINKYRAETLPAYKEVCREGGVMPKAVEVPASDRPKNSKKRSM